MFARVVSSSLASRSLFRWRKSTSVAPAIRALALFSTNMTQEVVENNVPHHSVLDLNKVKRLQRAELLRGSLMVEPKFPDTTKKVTCLEYTLEYVIELVSGWCTTARSLRIPEAALREANDWTLKASTFDVSTEQYPEMKLATLIKEGIEVERGLASVAAASDSPSNVSVGFEPNLDLVSMRTKELEAFGAALEVDAHRKFREHERAMALSILAKQGLKGCCIFAARCSRLESKLDACIAQTIHSIYHELEHDPETHCQQKLLLRVGKLSHDLLQHLDEDYVSVYGRPAPTGVKMFHEVAGKSILVAGYDMAVLHKVLMQTRGTGISIYTHGGLLNAHSYPIFQTFDHLAGHYESAWNSTRQDFDEFPGPIVVASDNPFDQRKSSVVFPSKDGKYFIGTETSDFSLVIDRAQIAETSTMHAERSPQATHMTGYHHRVLNSLIPEVRRAILTGDLKRILLFVGNGDTEVDQKYFTQLGESAPVGSMILMAGRVKNGMIHSDKGTVSGDNGLPGIVDLGQTHDTYSAIVFLEELAKAMDGLAIADMPVSVAMSHSDKKDTALLLALLENGFHTIRLGPGNPPNVTLKGMEVFCKTYNIMPTGDPKQDMEAMMEGI